MASPSPAAEAPVRKPWYHLSLTRQILIGLVLGCLIGWWMNGLPAAGLAAWSKWLVLIRNVFLDLVKMMMGPLVFGSLVQGIAGTGDLKRVGRIGVKTLLYFE